MKWLRKNFFFHNRLSIFLIDTDETSYLTVIDSTRLRASKQQNCKVWYAVHCSETPERTQHVPFQSVRNQAGINADKSARVVIFCHSALSFEIAAPLFIQIPFSRNLLRNKLLNRPAVVYDDVIAMIGTENVLSFLLRSN